VEPEFVPRSSILRPSAAPVRPSCRPRTVNGLVTLSVGGSVDKAVNGVASEPVNRGCLTRPRSKPSGAVAERRAWAKTERSGAPSPRWAGGGAGAWAGTGTMQEPGTRPGQAEPGRARPGRAEAGPSAGNPLNWVCLREDGQVCGVAKGPMHRLVNRITNGLVL
jgi:hypothetical protein